MKKSEFKRLMDAQNLRCGHGHSPTWNQNGEIEGGTGCTPYNTLVRRYNAEFKGK